MKMMKTFMETLLLNVKESFERSFSALQAELFEMRRVFERETFHRQQLEEEVKELRDGMEKLNREVVQVREREEDAEQEKRNLDIVIDNVPADKVSDKTDHFCSTVNKVLLAEVIKEDDVERVEHFLNRKKPQKMTIIATLKNDFERKEIMRQKKMFREKNLFVKENLIKSRYQLLKLTREFAQRNFFKFVWTRGGKIFIRKSETSPAICVRRRGQLDEFA